MAAEVGCTLPTSLACTHIGAFGHFVRCLGRGEVKRCSPPSSLIHLSIHRSIYPFKWFLHLMNSHFNSLIFFVGELADCNPLYLFDAYSYLID